MRGIRLVFVFGGLALLGGFLGSGLRCAAADRSGSEKSVVTRVADNDPSDKSSDDAKAPKTFWEIVFSGGPFGFCIVLLLLALSMLAFALGVEHAMTIRHKVLMPAGLAESVRGALAAGKGPDAKAQLDAQPSFLAFVVTAGLEEIDGGWSAVEKAMEEAAAEQSARLFRKIEYLSVIGNIAPMIGLLGTVTGMIIAFQAVADVQGAERGGALATGIYQALVTTVLGLVVAIPSLAAFAVYRNRVDHLVAEVVYVVQQVTIPLKRIGRRRGKPAPSAPATPPPIGGAPA